MINQQQTQLPIGVFDSGVGGLTVLQALQKRLPQESFLYLGDTARLPYGTKGPETIIRYAKQASEILLQHGVKLLVIACNTASSVSLSVLQHAFPEIPIVGVIEPGARLAAEISRTGNIAVIATEATVNAQGYQLAIKRVRPEAQVIAKSCGLFVALAEEGWVDGPIVQAVAHEYLQPMIANNKTPIDCLVLGCTHFPALIDTIKQVIGNEIAIVNSAETTAKMVEDLLQKHQLNNMTNQDRIPTTFFVTDAPGRFIQVAKRFLGLSMESSRVELVDLRRS